MGGVEVHIDSDVPIGAGLSSSAALECSVALALHDLYGLPLSRQELAESAQRAENEYVGVPTGIMDQTASLRCRAGHALFLDTRSLEVRQVPFDLERAGLDAARREHRGQARPRQLRLRRSRRDCLRAAEELGVASAARRRRRRRWTPPSPGSPTTSCGAGPGTSSASTAACSKSSGSSSPDGRVR